MDKTTKGGLAVGVLLLGMLLGNAITGASVIGYHADCIDGIDNNQNGMIDGMDYGCSEYPYADGNGEDYTPKDQRMTGENYVSLFEYHIDYMVTGSPEQENSICSGIMFPLYDENDMPLALQWENDNAANCAGGGP